MLISPTKKQFSKLCKYSFVILRQIQNKLAITISSTKRNQFFISRFSNSTNLLKILIIYRAISHPICHLVKAPHFIFTHSFFSSFLLPPKKFCLSISFITIFIKKANQLTVKQHSFYSTEMKSFFLLIAIERNSRKNGRIVSCFLRINKFAQCEFVCQFSGHLSIKLRCVLLEFSNGSNLCFLEQIFLGFDV